MKKWYGIVSFICLGVVMLACWHFYDRSVSETFPEPHLKLDPRLRDLSVDHALILMREEPGSYDNKTTRTLKRLDAVIDNFITEMCRSPESSRAISLVAITFSNYIDFGKAYQTSDVTPIKTWIGTLRAFAKDQDTSRAAAASILLSLAYHRYAGGIEGNVAHYEANGGGCEDGDIDSEGEKWRAERRIKYYRRMADDLVDGILASKRLARFHPMCLSLRISEMVEARAQNKFFKPRFYRTFCELKKTNAYLSYAARDAEFRRRLSDLQKQWPYTLSSAQTSEQEKQIDAQRKQLRKKMQEVCKVWFEFNIAEFERMPVLRENLEVYVNTFHAAYSISPPDRVPCFERLLVALGKKTDPPDLLRPYRIGLLDELAEWYFNCKENEKSHRTYLELIATDPDKRHHARYKLELENVEKAIREQHFRKE